ncbi:hypothetical protein [Flavivirga eckloniae]|nr:hypothetical protein [Flavivirga eckloniae]
MGIFDKLFGGQKEKSSDSSSNQKLRMEYNIMKNISLEKCQKYENTNLYEVVENGIYKDLTDEDDAKYRMTISYELESDENNNQYPLEDVLDKYYLHVSDFLESENNSESNEFKLELGGDLDDIKKSKEIIGKRIFNRDFLDEGQVRVKLMVE